MKNVLFTTVGGLNRNLRAQFVATLLFRSGTMAFPFLAIYLIGLARYDAVAIGIVVAAFGAGALVADLIAGPLLKRVPARTVMIGALILNAVALLIAPGIEQSWLLVPLTFMWGMFYETYTPANHTETVAYSQENERKIAFSCNRLAINIGMGIGPALGSLIYLWEPVALFYINALMVTLAALFYWSATRQRTAPAIAAGVVPGAGTAPAPAPAAALGRPADFRFWTVFAVALPIHFAYALPPTLLGTYVISALGLPSYWVGVLFSLNALLVVLCELPINVAMQGTSRSRSLAIGYVLAAMGFLVMGLARSPVWLVLGTLLWTFGEIVVYPSLLHTVSEVSARPTLGRNMGLYSAGGNIGLMAAPQVALAIAHHGDAGAAWWLSGGAIAIALAVIFYVRRQPAFWLAEHTT